MYRGSSNIVSEFIKDIQFEVMTEIKKSQNIQGEIERFKTKCGILFSLVAGYCGILVSRTNSEQIAAAELKLQNEIRKAGFTISIKTKI